MASSTPSARIVQISVNPSGGVPKHRVPEAQITAHGIAGDKQRDRRYHGGPKRAVSLYSYEHILALQDEGHPIDCGTCGENLTILGLDWESIQIGDQISIGPQARLEITAYAAPCHKIASSFVDGEFQRISQKLRPGWSRLYARVLCEGTVREGDAVIWE